MTDLPDNAIPIACDMTDATDTPEERLAEYQRLFSTGLIARERTERRIRFRFAERPGLADWVRDLSTREHACGPFMFFEVTSHGEELRWDITTVDDRAAKLVLDGLYDLPDSQIVSVDDLLADYGNRGVDIVATDKGFEQAQT